MSPQQPLHDLTLHDTAELLTRREISSTELTKAVLERIEKVDEKVKAFVSVTGERALADARASDERSASGRLGPLDGAPMMLKDNICTSGIRTTCSSRMLENFVPPYDAHVTERLRESGAVLVGKGNLDEFAMGSSTENSAFFTTRNPWDLGRVPGGSIRQPASFCGVVGLKPTYGAVSRYGLVAFGSSLDQIGPVTKDVTDSALVMNAIAGHDSRDSTSVPFQPPDYTQALTPDIRGMKIGVPKEYFVEGIGEDVVEVMERAIAKLEDLGAEVDREVSLPHTKYALAVYYIIAPSEASANLARYDGVKYGYSAQDAASMWEEMEKTRQHGFGPEVKRRIMLGTYALSSGYYDAYYLKAQKVRTLIRGEFEDAFERYDALIAPTCPTPAFALGDKTEDPVQMYLSDICTIPANIAGIPAISVPAGFSFGLPVGMQIMGKPFGEPTIFRLAYAYEQSMGWWRLRAPV